MNKNIFQSFFKEYAKNVDNANQQQFWQLSDDIILSIIKKNLPKNITLKNIILDAGGGTGRWIIALSKIFKAHFILYDISKSMLERAKNNIKKANLQNKVEILQGDLIKMDKIANHSVDFIISIYNPISFVDQKEKMVNELYRILKRNGILLIMGQGFFNALTSKINNGISLKDFNLLEKTSKVSWNDRVPALNVFSKQSLESLLKSKQFKIIKSYGVPLLAQPGAEDFDPKNVLCSQISKALKNKTLYKKILSLEMKYNSLDNLVDKGMNILTVAKK
jgi:ubiquinone/menaquinone biosynthesis C-methylase UbiE